MKTIPILAALLAAAAWPALAQDDAAGTAAAEGDAATSQGGTGPLVAGDGSAIGNASVSLTASGNALVLVQAEGIPEGVHAVHLHMVGACEGPTFESAGEHIADGHEHGVMAADGPHPGDLPNAEAGADGVMTFEGFAIGLTEELLFDADGSALIVHASADDHTSQPSGNSGDRIACAVVEAAGDGRAEATEAQEDAPGG